MKQSLLAREVEPAQSKLARWLPIIVLLLIVMVGTYLRAYDLGSEGFDGDELSVLRFPTISVKNLVAKMGERAFCGTNPPLELVPYQFWVSVFGTGEAAVRTLPMLLGIAAILLLYRLGKRLGGPWVGVLAAAGLTINPLVIAYSQEARAYSMLVLLTIALNLLFVRCVQTGRSRDKLWYLLVAVVAIFTQYFAVPVLGAHGLIALWLILTGDASTRRMAIGCLLTLVAAIVLFLAWLPIIYWQSHAYGSYGCYTKADAPAIFSCFTEVFALGQGWLTLVCATAIGLLTGIGIWGYRQRGLPAADVDNTPPLPRLAGALICIGGLAGSAVMAWVAPSQIIPTARNMLATANTDNVPVEAILGMLRWYVVLPPAMLGMSGAVIYAWPWLSSFLNGLPQIRIMRRASLTAGLAAGSFLILPLVVVWVLGFSGSQFISTRNLIIVAPPLYLALALGLWTLRQNWIGRVLAIALSATLAIGAWQYEPLARPLGGSGGLRLGYHTGPWQELNARLKASQPSAIPVLAAWNWAIDPGLHYLADLNFHRITKGQEAKRFVDVSGRAVFIHLVGNPVSTKVLSELSGLAASVKLSWTLDGFEIYEVQLKL